jgi:hypothetical protein
MKNCVIVKYRDDLRSPKATETILSTRNDETQIVAESCGKCLGLLLEKLMKYDVICIDEGQFVCYTVFFLMLMY